MTPNTSTATSSSTTTTRYRQKREAILSAAAQLFEKCGFKGTMLSEVANMVGLSTNSITYYFKKKEDLFFECQMHTINTFSLITDQATAGETPADRVRRFIRTFVDIQGECSAGRYPTTMSFRDFQELDPSSTKLIFSSYRDMFRRTRDLLADGPLQTSNRMALTMRTHLLLTMTQWSRLWLAGSHLPHYARIADFICDIVLNGLAAPGSRWHRTTLDEALAAFPLPESPNHGFLAAAINLINEVGYDGASIDRISARLSVTKGSFYHHIPSKEDLYAECIQRTVSVVEGMQEIVLHHEGTGLEKLSALGRALVDFHFSPRGPLLRTSAWSGLPNYTQFHDRVQPVREFIQTVTDLVALGMMDGSLRSAHQQIGALMLVAMISGAATLDKWVPGSEQTDVTDLYVRPFFEGICSPISG